MNRSQRLHQTLYDLLPMLPNELITLIVQYTKGYQIIMSGGQGLVKEVLSSCLGYDVDNNEWYSFPKLSVARCDHCMVSTPSGDLYVLGGWDQRSLRSTERFDRKEKRWVRGPDLPEKKRYCGATYVASGANPKGCIIMNGGCLDYLGTTDSWCLDLNTETWRPVLGHMRLQRNNHGFILAPNGKFYALSADGYDDQEKCEAFDPRTRVWSNVADMQIKRLYPVFLYPVFALGCDGKIYVFGLARSFYRFAWAECYDPDTDTWTKIPPPPEAQDYFACVSCPNGKIYLLGGTNDNGWSASCCAFDVLTRTYSRIQDLPERRAFGKAVISCF